MMYIYIFNNSTTKLYNKHYNNMSERNTSNGIMNPFSTSSNLSVGNIFIIHYVYIYNNIR